MAKRYPIAVPLLPALLASTTLILSTEARAEPPPPEPAPASASASAPAPASASAPAPASAPASAPALAPASAPVPPPPPPGAYPYPPYPYPPYGYPPPPGWQPAPPPAPPLRFDSAAEIPPDDEGLYEPGRKRRKGEDEWIPRSSSKPNTAKAGGILIGVGLGVAVLGGALTAIGLSASSSSRGGELSRGLAEGFFLPFGVVTLVLGGGSVAVGIPLYAVSR